MVSSLVIASLIAGPTYRASQVDVTPGETLPLGGYTARGDKSMEEGGDPLFVRTLVFADEDTTVAIVSFEALTVPESLLSAVKKRLPDGVDLFLSATHTHSAPDSQMLNERMTFKIPGIASFLRRWMDWYADKIAEGVKGALGAASADASRLQIVQSEIDANRGRREGAEPIKTATFLRDGSRVLLTSFAAHATVYEESRMKTSGDWPGAVATGLGGLVLPGVIGDVSPSPSGADSVEKLGFMVEKLRSGLAAGRVKGVFDKRKNVAFVTEMIALEKPVPHPEFARSFGAPEALAQVLIQRFSPVEGYVSLVALGDVLLVGIPGEPTSEIGRKVQVLATDAGYPQSLVVSHTNGWIGYILTPTDYDRGGYEATLSFHGRETSKRVTEAVERGLKKLGQAPRVAHTR